MEKLFRWKILLLTRLKENLQKLIKSTHFHHPQEELLLIYLNEKIVRILSKIDKRILKFTHTNPELYKQALELLEECFILHTDFEIRWESWTKSYQVELNEMEIRRQLREHLRRSKT